MKTFKKENIFLDLSKCTEEEQKHIFSLLPPEPHRDAYNIFRNYKYLQFIPKSKFQEKEKWMVDKQSLGKTEITYPEFIYLFEGGEGEMKVDIYSGELNTERILTYKKLSEQYNIEESTVRDIFNAGAEWVNKLNSNQ